MRIIKKFIVGSKAFFSSIKDFSSKDTDVLCILDTFPFNGDTNCMRFHIGTDDIILYRNMNKEGFIEDTINSNVPMKAGKFLVPAFAEYLNLSIEDLEKMQCLFNSIDNSHSYEKVIYDNYIINGKFMLTEEQLNEVYNSYKRNRDGSK